MGEEWRLLIELDAEGARETGDDAGPSGAEHENTSWDDGRTRGDTTSASWTVTVSLEHHGDLKRLAEEPTAEGYDVSSSWHTLRAVTANRHDAELLVAEIGIRSPGAETEVAGG